MEIHIDDLNLFFFCPKKLHLLSENSSYEIIKKLKEIINQIMYRKMIKKNIKLGNIEKKWNILYEKVQDKTFIKYTSWLLKFIEKYKDSTLDIRAISIPFTISIRQGLNITGELPIVEKNEYGFNLLIFNFDDPCYENLDMKNCIYAIYKKAFEAEFGLKLDYITVYNVPFNKKYEILFTDEEYRKSLSIVEWLAEGMNDGIEYPIHRKACIACEYYLTCSKEY